MPSCFRCMSAGWSNNPHLINSTTPHPQHLYLEHCTYAPAIHLKKMKLINIFPWILSPQVCLVTLTYTQISAEQAIYSAVVAGASISVTGFTMIYEPAHWPSLFWKEKSGHIPSYLWQIHPQELASSLRDWDDTAGQLRSVLWSDQNACPFCLIITLTWVLLTLNDIRPHTNAPLCHSFLLGTKTHLMTTCQESIGGKKMDEKKKT